MEGRAYVFRRADLDRVKVLIEARDTATSSRRVRPDTVSSFSRWKTGGMSRALWPGMRTVTALAVVAHIAIAFVACFDPFSPEELQAPAPPPPPVLAVPAETLSVDQVEALDREIDRLMVAIQEDGRNVDATLELARLYAGQGWFEQAIPPLARAAELEPERSEIFIELGVALGRAGHASAADVDLFQEARDFEEAVDLWGHGC